MVHIALIQSLHKIELSANDDKRIKMPGGDI